MQLTLDKANCNKCSERLCIKACPNKLGEKALECIHCDPETAKCVNACPKNAFYRVTAGIIAVDKEKCNGCGQCMEACERNAIELRNGKAVKCDLCAYYGFEPVCVQECRKGAVKLEKNAVEEKKHEIILGWACFEPNARGRLYRKKPKIMRAEKEAWYYLPLPDLSHEEALLLKEVLESHRNNGSEQGLKESLNEYCQEKQLLLEKKQKQYLKELLESEVNGFGPLDVLLEDNELEEIALAGIGKEKPVRVFHRVFGWCNCNVYFSNSEKVRVLVNKMLRKSERRLNMSRPFVNGSLPNGSRINATLPPVSLGEPTFTIRKFRAEKFTAGELVKNSTVSADAVAFLECALQTDCSLLISGNTGSGKTTTLNALMEFVPLNERIVIVEETPEMQVHHKHQVRLAVCNEKGIEMNDLIENTLRMRPDRIIVSEIRSEKECRAFINTILAGQGKGSYATFHANSAEETVKRLEFLGVKKADVAGLDLIAVQRRWPVAGKEGFFEKRRVTEIAELNREGKPKKLFEFDYKKERLEKTGNSKRVKEKIKRTFGENAEKIIKGRKKELEGVK